MLHIHNILAALPQDTAVEISAAAQTQAEHTVFTYYFFTTVIAGIIMAVGFELFLTNLSVATGLNIAGTYTKPRGRSKRQDEGESSGVMGTVRTVTSAAGAMTLVTAIIALFFASWLAVMLAATNSYLIGAILGLVIWGFFYFVMISYETSAIASLVGSLGWLAASGLKGAYKASISIFSKSPEQQIADATVKAAKDIKEELFGDIEADDVKDQIQKYINMLRPAYSPRQWRKEIQDLLDDVEIDAVVKQGAKPNHQKIVAKLEAKGITRDQADKMAGTVQNAFETIRQEKGKDKSKTEKTADTAMRMAGLSPEDAEATRKKFEDYLRRTGKEQLSPEGIKADIEKLFSDPKAGVQALKDRVSSIDKETIVSVLAQRKDIDQNQARQIVDRFESIFNTITGKARQQAGAAKEAAAGAGQQPQNVLERIESKVSSYLDSLGRPEFDYQGIKADVEKLFTHPKAGADALINRLKSMDRDSLKALLASRSDISDEDAERIIQNFENTRENLLRKAQSLKDKALAQIDMAKNKVLEEIDETRKTAATAAWWSFATALFSGIAAAGGGVVAIATH